MSDQETISVGSLEVFIAKSKYLHPYLSKNDKTPSWDGNIFLNSSSGNKKDVIGAIHIQVKSRSVKEFAITKTKKQFSKSDLKNYSRYKGI